MQMMRTVQSGLVLAIALLATNGARAQDKPADDVVVTGRKTPDTRTATRFVNRISAATKGQIARFGAPVCPVAIGFAPAYEKLIVVRVREIAALAGAEVAGEHCEGNVVLMATQDARALVRELRRKKPRFLGGLEPFEIDRLIDQDGPVRSWSTTGIVNEDGQRATGLSGGSRTDMPLMNVKTASFLNPTTKQLITSAVVVIDSKALIGKSLTQLADYTAMRALAKTRPLEGDAAAVDSILTLFDPAASPPPVLTTADLAYLRTLYALPGNRNGIYQAARIAKGVKDAFAPPAP
jgi:hypothetical protein